MEARSKNYLSLKNRGRVWEASSASSACLPDDLLSDSEHLLWVSETGLPQTITFDLRHLLQRPSAFRCFGWHCWHAYTSNPSLVDLYRSADGTVYEKWATFYAEKRAGPQLFPMTPLDPRTAFIRVVITDTFGSPNTYMNQVFLYESLPESSLYQSIDFKAKLHAQLTDLDITLSCMDKENAPATKKASRRPRAVLQVLPPDSFQHSSQSFEERNTSLGLNESTIEPSSLDVDAIMTQLDAKLRLKVQKLRELHAKRQQHSVYMK